MHWQYQGKAEAIGPPPGPEQWQPTLTQPRASLNRTALFTACGLVFLPPPVTVDQWQNAPPQPDRTPRRAQATTGAVAPLLPPSAVIAPTWFDQGTQPQPSRAFRLTRTPETVGPVYVPPVVATVALDWLQALGQPNRPLRAVVGSGVTVSPPVVAASFDWLQALSQPRRVVRFAIPAGLTQPVAPASVPFDWLVQGAQPVRLRFTAARSQVVGPVFVPGGVVPVTPVYVRTSARRVQEFGGRRVQPINSRRETP